MYHAKEAGKNQVAVFDVSMQDASSERLSLGIDLRGAVERGEFILHYQPIVALPDRRVVGRGGAGPLAPPRARDDPAGGVHPDRRADRPDGPDRRVRPPRGLPAGARLAARRGRQPPLSVSVNVSGVQLQHPGLVGGGQPALEDADLEPELLMIEITESVVARETDATVAPAAPAQGARGRPRDRRLRDGLLSLSYLAPLPGRDRQDRQELPRRDRRRSGRRRRWSGASSSSPAASGRRPWPRAWRPRRSSSS